MDQLDQPITDAKGQEAPYADYTWYKESEGRSLSYWEIDPSTKRITRVLLDGTKEQTANTIKKIMSMRKERIGNQYVYFSHPTDATANPDDLMWYLKPDLEYTAYSFYDIITAECIGCSGVGYITGNMFIHDEKKVFYAPTLGTFHIKNLMQKNIFFEEHSVIPVVKPKEIIPY